VIVNVSSLASRVPGTAYPSTPLHTTVGDDADMYLGLLAQVDGFEGWMDAVIPIVEATVGPRPAPGSPEA
jgi:hypothetical protein